MTKEKFSEARAALLAEAETLLAEDKLTEFDAKTKEIEALDNQWEESCRKQANLTALKDKTAVAPLSAAAVGAAGTVAETMGSRTEPDDILDSAEYKRAFMAYVCSGTRLPEKFRNTNQTTGTSDAGVAIPSTTVQRIYEAMSKIGVILPLVAQTAIPGGVSVPKSTVVPTATWVAEGNGSDTQKETISYVSFSYYKLRVALAQTYEVANMAYPMFEEKLVRDVSRAIVKAKELAILTGDGSGKPTGVLTETAHKNIDITEGSHLTYAQLLEAEGAEEFDGAVWVMTKATYMSEFEGLKDSTGQPIARVNYGLSGKPEYVVMGRSVVIVPSDYMDSWAATVTADSIIAFMVDFSHYVLNSSVPLRISRYTDNANDNEVTKAIEVCDGKTILTDSLVTVTVKNG